MEQVDNRLDDIFGDQDGGQEGGMSDNAGASDEGGRESRGGTTTAEIDTRLDNFFEKEEHASSAPPKAPVDTSVLEKTAIKELKSVILSLEWEITDQVMQKLGEEIAKLEIKYKNDKIVVAFLQLLGSLGKYIRKKRAEAHPDSIRLLHSVYENLEESLLSSELSEVDKKRMLVSQVSEYKRLKDEIVVTKTASAEREDIPEEKPIAAKPVIPAHQEPEGVIEEPSVIGAAMPSVPGEELSILLREVLKTLGDIQKTIQNELSAIRGELSRRIRDKV
jgi:hypothetical protein